MPPKPLFDVKTFEIEERANLVRSGRLEENGKYAIISHRWTDKEIKYSDFQDRKQEYKNRLGKPNEIDHTKEPGLAKIAWACSIAKDNDIPYVWIDTCCIDKSPRSDLYETQQAINSMFAWYKEADICYAFLLDVCDGKPEPCKALDRVNGLSASLQELLAPQSLWFFDHHWRKIGTREDRSDEIQMASGIQAAYLGGDFLGACVAVKMSWLSRRTTGLRDDIAYCMLGLFGISMDVRYGEEENAFLRLEEELIRRTRDESIFAWTIDESPSLNRQEYGLLALWPSCFRNSRDLTTNNAKQYKPRNGTGYRVTEQGIEFEIPGRLADHGNGVEWNTLIANRRTTYDLGLNCWKTNQDRDKSVTIHLQKDQNNVWRRVNVESLDFGRKLRKSTQLFFPTTRPYYIPNKLSDHDNLGKDLADRVDLEISRDRDSQTG